MDAKPTAFLLIMITFSIGIVQPIEAQDKILIIEKTLSSKHIKYLSGDNITYKLKGEDFFRTDHIIALNDSAIKFHYHQILFDEIEEVNIKGRRFTGINFRSLGSTFQIVGLGYIFIDQFNQVVVRSEDPSFNQSVLITGGLIFVGGSILKMTQPNKVKLGRKYRIRYLYTKT